MSTVKADEITLDLLNAREYTMDLFGRGYKEFIAMQMKFIREYAATHDVCIREACEEICNYLDEKKRNDHSFREILKTHTRAACAEILMEEKAKEACV